MPYNGENQKTRRESACGNAPNAAGVFADDLKDYDVSKGTIRLPYDRPFPAELIARIAKWCFEEYAK